MKRLLSTIAMLLIATLPAPARTLQKVVIFSGACTRYALNGNSMAQYCRNKLSVNQFDDGRISFAFILKRIGSPDVISTITSQGNVPTVRGITKEPIDGFIYSVGSEPPKGTEATGTCSFGNLYKPPSFVECSVMFGGQKLDVRFETDRSNPTTINP